MKMPACAPVAALLFLSFNVHAQVAVTVSVDAAANRHAIDARIYGASWASAAQIDQLGLTLNRWGGNAMSRYNWSFSTANRCKDYFFFNIPDDVSSGDGSNGKSADDFIGLTFGAGAEPVMTIPMLERLPKDRSKRCTYPVADYPNQEVLSPVDDPGCGNGRTDDGNGIDNDGPRILNVLDPDATSTVYPMSHQGDWVQHMIDTWGNASANGMRYYSLDNEPGLWSFDHWDVHPTGSTYDEVWGKMSELAPIIRAKDANAVIIGPDEWGWSGYFMSGLDMENNDSADRDAHGGTYYIDWLMQQTADYAAANGGTRLLDVVAVHFYPQSGEFWGYPADTVTLQNLRNESTRSLWDPAYQDPSWIKDTGIDDGHVKLIPRLKDWAAIFPGTQTGITEYNWGADDFINGGTAQADILGIFGREGLDVGIRWDTPALGSFTANAFRMYRNYDGAHSKFGDVSVSTSAPSPDDLSAFGAVRSSDNALTVMIVAKNLNDDYAVTLNLANFAASGAAAERWELDGANAITHLADVPLAGSTLALTVPKQSITLLVLPGAAMLPAPQNLVATATSTSSVALSWVAVDGASGYEIFRSVNHAAFAFLKNAAGTTATDSALASNTTFVYEVRALQAGGDPSEFSAIDAATTTTFTDDPLNAGTRVKTLHVTQLRTAVNAMRVAGGLAPQAFTDSPLASGTAIKAVHLTQLQTALAQARDAIGLPAFAPAEAIVAHSTTVKASHLTELRNAVK